MVVMGVISVLLGIGVGFLQRGTTDVDAAIAVVRDQVRLASATARARQLPTQLHVIPESEGQPTRLQVHGLRPVGLWQMESDERWLDSRLRPQLSGSTEPGRFGEARRPNLDDSASMFTLATGDNDRFYLDGGFALRLELQLASRNAMTVARLGRAFELTLTSDLVPEAKVTLAAPGPRPGTVVTLSGDRPLPVGQWLTIGLSHDGNVLELTVDGRIAASTSARGEPFQRAKDLFEVSLGSEPIDGLVDEVQLLAYERGEAVAMPLGVELRDLQGPLDFGRRGELLTPTRFSVVLNDDVVTRSIGPQGVLQ